MAGARGPAGRPGRAGGGHAARRRARAGRRDRRDRAGVGLAAALYALAVLAVLAATGLQRLRICLRVADQAGRILAAVALPLLILLPWMPAAAAARLALWSAGLVFAFRVAVSAALRAAHRRGLLTEPALVIGAGTFGAHIGELMRAHPELGLRPQGYLDFGPPRRDLALPSLGTPADLAEVVARHGIRRVIVCYAACKDEDLVTVLRASRPLRADVCVVPRLYELGAAVPLVVPGRDLGHPADPAAAPRPLARGPGLKRAFDVAVAAHPAPRGGAGAARPGRRDPAAVRPARRCSARPGSPAPAGPPRS